MCSKCFSAACDLSQVGRNVHVMQSHQYHGNTFSLLSYRVRDNLSLFRVWCFSTVRLSHQLAIREQYRLAQAIESFVARRILRGVVAISNAYDNYNYVKVDNSFSRPTFECSTFGNVIDVFTRQCTCYVSAHGDKKHANKKII